MAALDIPDAQDLANQCLTGTDDERKGSAKILASNVSLKRLRGICESGLKILFNDANESVRAEASSCFRAFEDDEIKDFSELVESFIDSSSFSDNYDNLIRALDKTTAQVPELICVACHRFLDQVGKDAANAQKKAA